MENTYSRFSAGSIPVSIQRGELDGGAYHIGIEYNKMDHQGSRGSLRFCEEFL